MSDQRNGGIVWCEQTWNPLRGCSRVSAGCVNCYAEAMAVRFCGAGQPYEGTINPETKRWNGKVLLVPEKLTDPLRWKRPRMVFVNSMSDLFHEDVPDEFIDQVFAVMTLSPKHTFQVLTKRPARMLEYMNRNPNTKSLRDLSPHVRGLPMDETEAIVPWPRRNIWLGVTAENQEAADERIPLLLQTPAAVRWVSMEPLLGPVDLVESMGMRFPGSRYNGWADLDWVVVGGESGPHARPMHPDWARNLRDQCAAAGVAFLFKQWGEWAPNCLCEKPTACADTPRPEPGKMGCMFRCGKKAAGRMLDGKLHDGYPEVKP